MYLHVVDSIVLGLVRIRSVYVVLAVTNLVCPSSRGNNPSFSAFRRIITADKKVFVLQLLTMVAKVIITMS